MGSSIDLLWEEGNLKKGKPLHGPTAWIGWNGGEVKRALHLLTPSCVTAKEFDYQVDKLKEDLETIRKKAHRKFKEWDKKRRKE